MTQIKNSGIEAGFSPAPEALIQASCGATGRGRLILFLRLWKHAGVHDLAVISVATLAMECGLKVPTAKRDLAWLVANRWVHRIDRPGFTSGFQVRRFKGTPSAPGGTSARVPDLGAIPSSKPLQPDTGQKEEALHGSPLPMGRPLSGVCSPSPYGGGEIEEDKKRQTAISPPLDGPPRRRIISSGEGAADQPADQSHAALPVAAKSIKSGRRGAPDAADLPPDAPDLPPELSELLLAWWRRRCKAHPRADRLSLGRFNLRAIQLADQEGVLEDYLNKGIEAGWLSLGHQGMKRLVDELKASRSANPHTGSSMLGSSKPNPGQSGRRQEFLDEVVRLISPLEDLNDQNV